ncbi:MAG: major facilitator superfamily protein [Candidatus Desulfovibrio kirbyi]|jgi:MFS family permease|uniref:Major facilitator superfamily protein n=1 Tax=Candidatus Desulfovibrio kirbyi TaxID=2696086 RepID=A0A6L2R5B7_9BACT|nr:MFS transporter [Desulfovibrio sp.]GFH62737.1 MAG: major facilitator superfamily protein [Candidatus Desulfovibrio kirbyi]
MSSDSRPGLLSRDFILLSCLAVCSNSHIAVFYCFEQWLEGVGVSPNWRGVLISAMFLMVLLGRVPLSLLLLRGGRLATLACSTLILIGVMLAYPFVRGAYLAEIVLLLRVVQGMAVAVQSSCVVSVLVSCIPPGQSARGFALFSLTILLPYSIIPAAAEHILLPLFGGEPYLFASTAVLGIISLLMMIPLAPRLKTSEMVPDLSGLWRAMTHSGLMYVYLSSLLFSIMTILAIFFMKGLCSVTGARPEWFFTLYTVTIILVRVLGNSRLDALPHYRVIFVCAAGLALCMLGYAWGPLWAFIPITLAYGVGLGLLYPMLAALVYDRSTPATRSVNSNAMMCAFDASGTLAPLLGGLVVHAGFGYRGVFVVTAVSITLCGLCMLIDKVRNRN